MQKYRRSDLIDSGTYGSVFEAIEIESKEKYAAKIIQSSNLAEGRGQMLFMREMMILHKISHPAIVKLIGINLHSLDDPDKDKLQPTILTEYCPNKSLKNVLEKERNGDKILLNHWNFTKKYIILLGIADAMRYLHQNKIIHRDLKPANILIDSEFYPRICDFGQSTYFSDQSISLYVSGNVGSSLYAAPELFDDKIQYNEKVDVYSYAIIMYEIFTKKKPFFDMKNINEFTISNAVLNGKRPTLNDLVPVRVKDLIVKCWNGNPDNRPSFEEIFDLLSNDLTFLGENVELNKDEIMSYISLLKSQKFYQNEKEDIKSLKSKKNNNLNDIKEAKYCDIIKALISNSDKIDNILVSGILLLFIMNQFYMQLVKLETLILLNSFCL